MQHTAWCPLGEAERKNVDLMCKYCKKQCVKHAEVCEMTNRTKSCLKCNDECVSEIFFYILKIFI